MAALPAYDAVFTPRLSNIADFRALGCPNVHYLPFGFDDRLFYPPAERGQAAEWDVLFVGGADSDRVGFMAEFLRCGARTALAGGYWDRFPETRAHAIGVKSPEELNSMTASSKVNLCLVRRANRDGHVMRSFEIAAAGGCMLAEDTKEHRELFGPDGEAVVYFRTPAEACERSLWLLANPAERRRLSAAVRSRVGTAKNTYRARLLTMLQTLSVDFTAHQYGAVAE
jgi:spore maturation protein CgeB